MKNNNKAIAIYSLLLILDILIGSSFNIDMFEKDNAKSLTMIHQNNTQRFLKITTRGTIVVDDDGGQDFIQIQWAIDNASEGDVIYIWGGVYNESVVVNKTLTLIGNGSSTTIIDANNNGDAFYISGNWVNISGLNIRNSGTNFGDAGIQIEGGLHCTVFNNNCSNNREGIRLDQADMNIISKNICNSNSYYGIYLRDYSDFNSISNNTCDLNNYYGIRFDHSYNNTIINNSIKSNRREGIHLAASDNNTIRNNTCNTQNQMINYGIFLSSGSDNNEVIDNNLTRNDCGIIIGASSNNIIENNNCSKNAASGIRLYSESGNNTIKNNNCNSSSGEGIKVEDSYGAIMKNNSCISAYKYGVYLKNSNFAIISNCVVDPVLYNPIFLSNSNNITVSNNTCHSRSRYRHGLYSEYGQNITMKNNTFFDGGIFFLGNRIQHWQSHNIDMNNSVNSKPIYFWKNMQDRTIPNNAGQVILINCSNISITDQNIERLYSGISVGFSDNITINNNTCESGTYGIYLFTVEDCAVTSNTCNSNANFGIWPDDSVGNYIGENTCSSNRYGIVCSGNNNVIANNTCNLNGHWGIACSEGNSNVIFNNTASMNQNDGIYLRGTGYSLLDNTCAFNGRYGIYLSKANSNKIEQNTCNSNSDNGIYLDSSNSNNVTNNLCNSNSYSGIVVHSSENNDVSNNTCISNNDDGIQIIGNDHKIQSNVCNSNGDDGIFLNGDNNRVIYNTAETNQYGANIYGASDNNIEYNVISTNNKEGIQIQQNSDSNIIFKNELVNNLDYGIRINSINSRQNVIHHNAFINNNHGNVQARDDGRDNIWDNIRDKGNYWSDFSTRYSQAKNDRWMWDMPYEIDGDGGNNDRFPLCASPFDRESPTLISDNTSDSPTTGEFFSFFVDVKDNFYVILVKVIYSYDQITFHNFSMSDTSLETWTREIIVRNDVSNLYYYFYAEDAAKNIMKTPINTLHVIDDEAPIFISQNIQDNATTGDNFTFSTSIRDNVGVSSAYIYCTFDLVTYEMYEMSNVSQELWSCTIRLPSWGTLFEYYIYIEDIEGNSNTTFPQYIKILDNDPPIIVYDGTPSEGTTGDEYRFIGAFKDNINISAIYVNYTSHPGNNYTIPMVSLGNNHWELIINIDSNIQSLHYSFYCIDLIGNRNIPSLKYVLIIDNDPPIAYAGLNQNAETGDEIFFNSSLCSDNIEIINYTWSFQYNNEYIYLFGLNQSYIFWVAGNYSITLLVKDKIGNEAIDIFYISIIEASIVDDDENDDDDSEDDSDDDMDDEIEDKDDTDDTGDKPDEEAGRNDTRDESIEEKDSRNIFIISTVVILIILVIFSLLFLRIRSKEELKSPPFNNVPQEVQCSTMQQPISSTSIQSTVSRTQFLDPSQDNTIPPFPQRDQSMPFQTLTNASPPFPLEHPTLTPRITTSIIATKPLEVPTNEREEIIPTVPQFNEAESHSGLLIPPPNFLDNEIPIPLPIEKMFEEDLPPPPI